MRRGSKVVRRLLLIRKIGGGGGGPGEQCRVVRSYLVRGRVWTFYHRLLPPELGSGCSEGDFWSSVEIRRADAERW